MKIKISEVWSFFAVLVICSTVQLIAFFMLNPAFDAHISQKTIFFNSFTDSLIIYSPYIFIKPKWRVLIFIPAVITPLLLWVNTLYAVTFHDIMSLSAYELAFSIDGTTLKSAYSSVSGSHLFYLFALLVVLDFYVRNRRQITCQKISSRNKIVCILMIAALFLLQQGLIIRRLVFLYVPKEKALKTYITDIISYDTYVPLIDIVTTYGIPISSIRILCKKPSISLSEEQELKIRRFISSSDCTMADSYTDIFKCNRSKNLILIIVESFSSKSLLLPESKNVVPAITSILNDSASITNLSVCVQARMGRSADGQFIYNTGLLPLRQEPYVSNYSQADYPSIAKALKCNDSNYLAYEFIGEDRKLWRHSVTSISFGFNGIFDNLINIGGTAQGLSVDKAIFRNAERILRNTKTPFYAEITTLGMHASYSETKIAEEDRQCLDLDGIECDSDKNYLEALNHFDTQLAGFIKFLKRNKLYDNSVIVITGDHEADHWALSPLLHDYKVPLIIINSGIGLHSQATINQADIFPTILDVMGGGAYIPPQLGFAYRGVGKSMFCETDSTDDEEAWTISEWLIRSRKFQK